MKCCEKELKPLLISTKQLVKLVGLSIESIQCLMVTDGFPRPISTDYEIRRNLWRLADVEAWVRARKEKDL